MTAHDWFAGLLSTGQWLTIFIVAGLILGIVFQFVDDGADNRGSAFCAGLFLPLTLWLFIMLVLHFVSFLVGLWNWDYVLEFRR